MVVRKCHMVVGKCPIVHIKEMSHGRANSEMRQVMVAEGCPLTSHLREKTDKDFQFVATSSGVLTSCLTNLGQCNSGHFFITSFVVIQLYINRLFEVIKKLIL